MGEYIGLALVILLALLGCVYSIRWIVLRILTPSNIDRGYWLIPLSGKRPDAEYIIRCMAARRLWDPMAAAPSMLVVDTGLDEETRQIAQRVCEQTGVVRLVSPGDLATILQDAEQAKKMIAFPKKM